MTPILIEEAPTKVIVNKILSFLWMCFEGWREINEY